MKTEAIRSSFLISVVDSGEERRKLLVTQLAGLGYPVEGYPSFSEFESSLESRPPHFVFVASDDHKNPIEKTIPNIRELLPESLLFVLCPQGEVGEIFEKFHEDLFDCLSLPLDSPHQIYKSVDRACHLTYLIYQNEQMGERLRNVDIESENVQYPNTEKSAKEDESSKPSIVTEVHFQTWLEKLYSQPHVDHSVNLLLEGIQAVNSEIKTIYFRYIPHRRTLMSANWLGFTDKEAQSIGLSFNDLDPHFQSEQLRVPQKVHLLKELASCLFDYEKYEWRCHSILGDIRGMLLLTTPFPKEEFKEIDKYFAAFGKHCEMLELEKRLHSNLFQDVSTGVSNRHSFVRKLSEEVARARRIQMPVSLILLGLDQFPELEQRFGDEEVEAIMRSLARIIQKHSRINDVIGRFHRDQFAIILPHTEQEGALIKAERLRQTIEASDFSRVLKAMNRLTISLSVAEYPSLSSDGEDLIQLADENLYRVRSESGNQIAKCEAHPGFQPDFYVEKKVSSNEPRVKS